MSRSWQPFTKPLRNAVPRAAAVAASAPRPRWCCGCWCSSMSGTGATACWSQLGVPGFYAGGRRKGTGRQNDGTLGRCLGGRRRQAGSRPDCANRARQGGGERPSDACGYVVETNIHHPTDSTLLGDGVRVLIRTMKKITEIAGEVGTKLRDRSRGVKLRLLEIARIARAKGPVNYERLKQGYRRLLSSTSRVVGQAKRFSKEISDGTKRSRNILKQIALERLREDLEE